MRRKTAAAGCSYLAGMFFASFLPFGGMFMLSAAMLTAIAAVLIINSKLRPCLVLCFASALVGTLIYAAYYKFNYLETTKYDGKTADFSGEITDFRYISNDTMLVEAKGKLNDKTKIKLTFFAPDMETDYYDKITFTGKFSKISDRLDFPAESYNRSKGIYLQASGVKNVSVSPGGASLLKYIRRYSDFLHDRIEQQLPGDEGDLLTAMICGDRTGMDPQVKTGLYRMGIGHIIAVSGTHIVIVGSIMDLLLSLMLISKKKKLLFTEFAVVGFAVFSGMSPSAVRAALMMTVVNFSKAAKRRSDSLTSLALCGILLTFFSPYLIRNSSFLLSMAGTFAFGTAAPSVSEAVSPTGKLKPLWNSLLYSGTVWVCTLPFCFMFFDEISLLSPIMNLWAVPLCGAALVLAVLTAFAGGYLPLAAPLLKIAGLCLKPVLAAAQTVGKWWFSYIPLGYPELKLILIVSALIVAAAAVYRKSLFTAVSGTLAAGALCLILSAVVTMSESEKVEVYILSCENSFAAVLNKNRITAIIDTEGEASDACVKLLKRKGAVSVEKLFVNKNIEKTRADYYNSIDFCRFDYEDCLSFAQTDEFGFDGVKIQLREDRILFSYGNTVSLVKLKENESEDELREDVNLLVDMSSDVKTAATSYETVKFPEDGDGIIKVTLSPDQNPIIRRYGYAFD